MQRDELKIRKSVSNSGSKRQKYQQMIIGRSGWGALIKYELIVLFSSWVPGALGLALRSKLYPRLMGSCGRGVVFGTNVVLRHPHKIHIGANTIVDDNCMLDAKGVDNDGITLGEGVFIGRNTILSCKDGNIALADGANVGFNCEIYSSSDVRIGADTMIAAYVYLVGGGNYDLEASAPAFGEQTALESQGIEVAGNVWIGAHCTVLDGTQIQTGAVVAAGSVVSATVATNTVVGGVPARVIKKRAAGTLV